MKKNMINTMVATDSPPPMDSPPPPPSKRSRKSLIAVLVIVIIVVALIVGIYLATGGMGTNTPATPTATPNSGATATPISGTTPTPTISAIGANVAEASSLQFTVTITNSSGDATTSYTYSAKNAGTPNMMIRVEFTDPSSGGSFVYIVNGAQQKAWMETGGQWINLTSSFSDEFNSWDSTFKDYQNNLADWNGLNDWSYTVNGETVTIHNISVNPSLPDSLFEHS
jgi:outer membrane lipoprotein-sorting protein